MELNVTASPCAQTWIDVSAGALNMQADLKAIEMDAFLAEEYTKPNNTWSSRPTAWHLLSHGEGLCVEEYLRSPNKSIRCVAQRAFESTFQETHAEPRKQDPSFSTSLCTDDQALFEGEYHDYVDFKDIPLPLFSWTRKITVDDTEIMFCSCKTFERCGHFCAHQIAVAQMAYDAAGKTFDGFTHHDVAMRYLLSSMHLAFKSSTPPKSRALFRHLCANEATGPRLAADILQELEIGLSTPDKPAIDRA